MCALLVEEARELIAARDLSGNHCFHVIGGARTGRQVPHGLPCPSHQHRIFQAHPTAAPQLLEPRGHAEAFGGRVGEELVEQNADEVAAGLHREGHAFFQGPLHAERLEARARVPLGSGQVVAADVVGVDANQVA